MLIEKEKVTALVLELFDNINPVDRTADEDLKARDVVLQEYHRLLKKVEDLPAAEEVERWAVYIRNNLFCVDIRKYGAKEIAKAVGGEVHRVFIRRAE